jgi:UPF0755 protein
MKSTWTYLGIGLLILALVAGAGVYFWHGPQGGSETVIEIPAKSGTAEIARRLQAGKAIRSALLFRIYVVLTHQSHHLKAGEYAFASGASLRDVAERISKGKTVSHPLTVPEGFSAAQIAERLQQEGLTSAEGFMAVVHDPVFARQCGIPGSTLEGFLFPDTYQLDKGMAPQQVARRMVEQFRLKVGPELKTAAQKNHITFLQLVTLASIIEKEVKMPQERPMVASVFYNRLQKKMRLESCATVLYSQGRISGILSLDDLNTASPYNTYRHAGLPPGPIGNPGLSALQAAGHPAQTDYLFFVVRPDGQHVFSKDFETHKHAKWMQKRARRAQ